MVQVETFSGTAGVYNRASTPSIQSQLINGARYNLFKVNTRSHGTDVNNKFKIVILRQERFNKR